MSVGAARLGGSEPIVQNAKTPETYTKTNSKCCEPAIKDYHLFAKNVKIGTKKRKGFIYIKLGTWTLI